MEHQPAVLGSDTSRDDCGRQIAARAHQLSRDRYRVIVSYLRRYGTTTFASEDIFCNAQPTVVALDIVALMDVLQIDKAVLGGYLVGGLASATVSPPPGAELHW